MKDLGRIIRETVADFLRDKLDRASALQTLKLAGISEKGAGDILDAAKANTALVESYKAQEQQCRPTPST